MDDAETRRCLALHRLPGLADRALATLLQHYGAVDALWDSDSRDWPALGVEAVAARRFAALRDHWVRRGPPPDLEAPAALLQSVGGCILPLACPDYPALLRAIHDPPPLLYARGDVAALRLPQVAVVGSRNPGPAGRSAARWLAGEAAGYGLAVCSGLALGIDGEAHAAALRHGGSSVAVLACGIDTVYPRRHRELAASLARNGCVVTEFPPGSAPLAGRFPRRNRLISGLSLAVVVVEATLRSGSLITARMALEQGREVFALPWSVFYPGGRGCLRLLREGAQIVETFADIAAQLGPLYAAQAALQRREAGPVSPDKALELLQREVLEQVGYEATTADQIIEHSARPASTVLATLSALERAGLVVRWAGGYCRV